MENNYTTIISISKVDVDRFLEGEDYKYHKHKNVYESFISFLKSSTKSYDSEVNHINNAEFDIFLYHTGNIASWKEFIQSMFNNVNLPDGYFKTRFPSYLLVRKIDDSIYCMTAGMANHLIDQYKDKIFGISLIPKLVKKDENIIRFISDHRVYGRRNATKLSNRTTSNFSFEQNLEAIYSEMGTSLKSDIQQKLGLNPIMNDDGSISRKEINVTFNANVRINKQITFNEMNKVLDTVHKLAIDNTKNNFVVNFLVPVDKKGIKQTTVTKSYMDYVNANPMKIELAYNHDLNNAMENYTICNLRDDRVSESELASCGITALNDLNDIKSFIINSIANGKSSINILQQRKIKTDSYDDVLKHDYKLFELLETEYLFDSINVYLMEGVWYQFIEDYLEFLNKSYEELFDSSQQICSKLFSSPNLNLDIKKFRIENDLKNEVVINKRLIDSDMVYIDNVEIADAIYLENNEIILIHYKTKFNGSGMRDISGQINTSARIISEIRNMNYTSEEKLSDYITDLKGKNGSEYNQMIDTFYNLVINSATKITYISGFVEKVKRDVNSNYIKYLLDTTKHQLELLQYMFYFY